MTDTQFASLSPAMREAAEFCQWWNLAKNLPEFLDVMGKPATDENCLWASTKATQFRKFGVQLKNMRLANSAEELDYSVLQVIANRAMAELGRKKEEADGVFGDIMKAREEIFHILAELRKFKDRAVIYELAKGD